MSKKTASEEGGEELGRTWAPSSFAPVSWQAFLQRPAFWEAYFDAFVLLLEGDVTGDEAGEERLLALTVDRDAFRSVRERLFRGEEMARLATAESLPPMTAAEEETFARYGQYMPRHQVYQDRIRAFNALLEVSYRRDYCLCFEFDPLGVYLALRHPRWKREVELGQQDPHPALPVFNVSEWDRLGSARASVNGEVLERDVHRLLLAPWVAVTASDDAHAAGARLEESLRCAGLKDEAATAIVANWQKPWDGQFFERTDLGVVNTFPNSPRNERTLRARPSRARKIRRFSRAAVR